MHSHATTKFSSLNGATFGRRVESYITSTPPPPKIIGKNNLYQKAVRDSDSHLYYGYHGDIKPSNLLWFRDSDEDDSSMGIVKLTDFGSGSFSRCKSTRQRPTSLAHTIGYSAPECNNLNSEFMISYEFDIWSLGCIFLEFMTWFIGGWALLDNFRNSRCKNQDGEFDNGRFFDFNRTSDEKMPSAFVKEAVIMVSAQSLAHSHRLH